MTRAPLTLWTNEEAALLAQYLKQGLTAKTISLKLGTRTERQVLFEIKRLRCKLKPEQPKASPSCPV
jgi:hypothetical protein